MDKTSCIFILSLKFQFEGFKLAENFIFLSDVLQWGAFSALDGMKWKTDENQQGNCEWQSGPVD